MAWFLEWPANTPHVPRFPQQSGIKCDDECVTAFNTFKLQNSQKGEIFRFLVFRIKEEKIKLVHKEKANPSATDAAEWQKFCETLKGDKKDGAYGVYDMKTTSKDDRQIAKVIFVSWSPDDIPIKPRMLYGSTKESFKQALGSGIAYVLQASSMADLDYKDVQKMVATGR